MKLYTEKNDDDFNRLVHWMDWFTQENDGLSKVVVKFIINSL